jgi:hypothetical protein
MFHFVQNAPLASCSLRQTATGSRMACETSMDPVLPQLIWIPCPHSCLSLLTDCPGSLGSLLPWVHSGSCPASHLCTCSVFCLEQNSWPTWPPAQSNCWICSSLASRSFSVTNCYLPGSLFQLSLIFLPSFPPPMVLKVDCVAVPVSVHLPGWGRLLCSGRPSSYKGVGHQDG